jgi:hypothetical protein
MLAVFADTPTGNQFGPPSTSFSRAERLRPSGVRLRSARYARLRSASPRRGEAGWKKDNLQKAKYTGELLIEMGVNDPYIGVVQSQLGGYPGNTFFGYGEGSGGVLYP